ncbi:hypothetical protein [Belnapia rosea]|uniref:hypothetical protein n=1 Tax=Belnapia rosea TaxID=938405 RepID=UPI00115FF5BC|nr:hypothetical protein [Belnapia rosea]
MRAIEEGLRAADAPGVIPASLTGGEREAWRQGYARGWNTLGDGSKAIDLKELRPFRASWQAGCKAGLAVGRAAASTYTAKVRDEMFDRTLALVHEGHERWTQEQRDGYDDGVAAGRKGLVNVPTRRFRGFFRGAAPFWYLGWRVGQELMGPHDDLLRRTAELREREARLEKASVDLRAREEAEKLAIEEADAIAESDRRFKVRRRLRARHAEARAQAGKRGVEVGAERQHGGADGAEAEGAPRLESGPASAGPDDAGPSSRKRRKSGAERQREHRARKRSVSIEISATTHASLSRLCERDGATIDRTLRVLLEAALRDPRIGRHY